MTYEVFETKLDCLEQQLLKGRAPPFHGLQNSENHVRTPEQSNLKYAKVLSINLF